ncbi:thiol reductant ABC exporter subunit CydC [Actinoplanes sp. CA-015351]|uniref:thiol reductant ABC exporter subunit CydC n=1 Tax=Actinoplanes sp. CA-015351 TaxID=3239897 RepID=UPI003D9896DE
MSRGPVDPRLLRHARSSRAGVALLTLIGAGQAAATIALAVALCWIVAGPRDTGVVLLAGAFAVRAVLAWAEQVVARRTAARVTDELRRSMLDAVVRRGPAWVAAYGSGRLSTVLATGLDALKPWFSGYLPAVALGVILPPLVILVMFVVDPASAIIALLTLPLIPLLGALIGWATQARARQRWAADARLAGHFLDVVRGLATLKVFGRAERQTAVIADLTDQHRRATMRVLRVAFLSSTALDLVGTLSVGLIAVQAGLRVAAGSMELAPALLVILLAPEAYRPLREMAARYHAATDATAVIADVDEILTASSPDDHPAGPARGDQVPRAAAVWDSSGRWGVRVSALRARYPGSVTDAVFLPELTVRAGEAVALRGPSGAGKTTVLRVLAGLHPAETGALAVGSAFYLPQRPSLPHARTVAEVFPPDSSPAEIAEALRTVGLTGEVTASTPLSEHGAGISSGQRQRLALAALLHRATAAISSAAVKASALTTTAPKPTTGNAAIPGTAIPGVAIPGDAIPGGVLPGNAIPGGALPGGALPANLAGSGGLRARPVVTLLLDEPTAHLDAAAEKLVIARLRDLANQGCALLVVAHRPALLSAADRVVTLNPPDAAEQGGRPDVQPAAVDDSRPGTAEHHGRPDVQPPAVDDSRPGAAEHHGRPDVQPPAVSDSPLGTAERHDSRPGTAEHHGRPDVQPAAARDGRAATRSPAGGGGRRWEWVRRPGVAVGLGAGASLAGVLLTGAAAWLLVRASSLPPVLTLSGAVVLVRGSAVARPLLRYLERLVSHDLAFARLGQRRARVYADLIPRVPGRRAHRRGDLLTKLVDDVDAQVDGLLRGRLPACATAATVVIAGLAALLAAPAVVVPLAVGVLIAGVLAPAVAAWQAGRLDAVTGAARASLRNAVVETVDGIEEVGSGSARSSVPMDRSRTLAALEARAARESGLAAALAHLGWGAAAAGTALVLARSGLSAEWSAVALLGMVTLGDTVVALPEAAIARRQAAGAARRVRTLTAQPPTSAMVTLSEATPSSGPNLRVRNLTAGWDRELPPVLDGFDLELPAGSRTAVTGRSGSGKSTLAAVLGRLLDPWTGTVEFDGKTVLVGDETGHVFASTVRENLRLAAPSATDPQLLAALARVGLDAWVAALPDGLDTWLGTGGNTISGGQRRRLSTARALLAEPDLLILDEPTEGIDEAGAHELMADLLGAASGRTVLIFAHRTEGLDLVDRVIDLKSVPYQPSYARMD